MKNINEIYDYILENCENDNYKIKIDENKDKIIKLLETIDNLALEIIINDKIKLMNLTQLLGKASYNSAKQWFSIFNEKLYFFEKFYKGNFVKKYNNQSIEISKIIESDFTEKVEEVKKMIKGI